MSKSISRRDLLIGLTASAVPAVIPANLQILPQAPTQPVNKIADRYSPLDPGAVQLHGFLGERLTDEELAQLDNAHGAEFDRLFLTAMIRHHQGAITMVDQLFGTSGAGQDEVVFRFASDVYADQTTEIERMQKMLAATPGSARTP